MVLNDAGRSVIERWQQIPARFPTVDVDAFVAKPEHVHGIVFTGVNADQQELPTSVSQVVHWFKTVVQIDYRTGVHARGWQPYAGTLWQRGFHDHIIRNDRDLEVHQRYIEGNPGRRWEQMGERQCVE